ncbi:hypothetical protein C6N75_01940 [Streptomyces solincola]|uniref:Uncharacterized protein n=1 Tax=Streptomyces solincola TaxID=2100817 RepID=A0A2S9Q2C3_9ACTN|nr:hypothetical protein [Streptomyces solincola]PRH80835.1 hypothetical protein C6N75_01940 [Streptomyces solincola]
MRTSIATAGLTAVIAAGALLASPGTASAAEYDRQDPFCAQLQKNVDDYRAGRVFYFMDPTPAWRKQAKEHNCVVRGLNATP